MLNLAGKLSLTEYATAMKFAKYVIGVDSASVHVASAVGSEKIIALYGPTYIESSKPYETRPNQVYILSKNLPCSPCYATSVIENCNDNICMKSAESIIESHEFDERKRSPHGRQEEL